MFKLTSVLAAFVGAASFAQASHLDNIGGIFDTFKFDTVKFKTRTNCSLDKYPEVSLKRIWTQQKPDWTKSDPVTDEFD